MAASEPGEQNEVKQADVSLDHLMSSEHATVQLIIDKLCKHGLDKWDQTDAAIENDSQVKAKLAKDDSGIAF